MAPTTTEPARLSKRQLFVVMGYVPHEGQLAVHRSKASRRVLACGARWGKSLCASMEACAALLMPCTESLGWLVAPTRDLVDRIFLRVVDALKTHFPARILHLDLRTQRIVVTNLGGGRSELRGKSADMPVTLLGEEVDYLILDEAVRLREEVWSRFLSQRLVNRNGWALLLSTPAGGGWFHELYRRGIRDRDPDFQSWSSPSWLNPHLDRKLVDAERARMSAEVFAQEYGGEFVGVDPEPCPGCEVQSPKASGVLWEDSDKRLPRCVICRCPVDEEGRSLVPRGVKMYRMIICNHGDFGRITDPLNPAAGA